MRLDKWIISQIFTSTFPVTTGTPLKGPSLANTKCEPSNRNIHDRLRLSSSSNRFRKQGNLSSHKPSETNEIKSKKFEKEIIELKKKSSLKTI